MNSNDDHSRHADSPASRNETGATRRFSLRTLMVIMLFYAAMFGVLEWMQMPLPGTGLIAGFVTAVGVAQAVLFGGRRPREASLLAGSLLCVGGVVVVTVWCHATGNASPDGSLLFAAVFAPLFGAVLGYIAGGFVGGAFLIARWSGGTSPDPRSTD